MTKAPGEDAIDGIKVDRQGNVYVSGSGGLWTLSPTGKHLGTIVGTEHPHNLVWGDADGKPCIYPPKTVFIGFGSTFLAFILSICLWRSRA
jgi:sugar lactone lactonase YvrE